MLVTLRANCLSIVSVVHASRSGVTIASGDIEGRVEFIRPWAALRGTH